MEQHPNVWDGVQGAVASVGSNVANNWQNLVRHCGRQLHPWQRNLSSFAAGLQQQLVPLQAAPQQQRQHRGQQQHCWSPALASISFGRGPGNSSSSSDSQAGNSSNNSSSSGSSLTAQPLFDLGMPKDEVKARLAPIPVYTVANPKNEFVLVAGENNTQLGFFFFRKEDAEAIIAKIREENPRLARDSKVLRVTMDNVYEVFTTPRETTGLQGIHFRFMPDMSQVKHALQLYKEAGVPTKSFVGVPVFQAEGLTVTTQDMQYVPLFLTKEDMDVAVGGAYRQRNASQISAVKEKAALYEEEYQTALKEVDAAAGRDKSLLEAKAGKVKNKLDDALSKASAIEVAPMPKIEVRALRGGRVQAQVASSWRRLQGTPVCQLFQSASCTFL
ncbi:Tic22-like family-domain-containing protein [Scenedesmus sp. NREL 46B-D3]|nr:Tic22-like family-domain-containing protein [Scenedesmus sp. NREL 46B-D3]